MFAHCDFLVTKKFNSLFSILVLNFFGSSDKIKIALSFFKKHFFFSLRFRDITVSWACSAADRTFPDLLQALAISSHSSSIITMCHRDISRVLFASLLRPPIPCHSYPESRLPQAAEIDDSEVFILNFQWPAG